MKKTVDYYKKVVKRAESESARASIVAGKQRYEHECELLKGSYGEGITGETGYEEGLARLKAELDAKIESAQYSVLEVLDEYSVEIPSEDLEKLATVGDVVEYLKGKGVE